MGAHRKTVLALLGLWVLSFALYARTISFDFVDFDDKTVLLGHPNLYDETSLPASLSEIFVGYFPREEPLLVRDVSWAVDARLFGFRNPVGYHLGNVLLNATNVALLFLFLNHATRRFRLALGVAGAFALLPVHVEPVCWVMGRKDLLATLFILLGFLAQSHELGQPDPRRRRSLYLLAILCTALAVLSKMAAVVFFLVLGAHRIFQPYLNGERDAAEPIGGLRRLREVSVQVAPHAAVAVGCFLWFRNIIATYGVIGWRGPGPLDPEHLATVARFTPLVIGQYLAHLVWPSQLSMFYRWPHVEIPLTSLQLLGSVVIAAALAAATLICCLRRRDLAFYVLTFLILLIPYLSIVYVDIWMADRYIYLASFCILTIGAILIGELWSASARPARVAVGGLVLVFLVGSGLQTLRQQAVWRGNESLWVYEANRDEPSLLAIQALAKTWIKKAEREKDPALRSRWIEQARREIARGIERERALGRQPSPYATAEQLQLSRLYYLQGKLAALEGAPLEVRLAHFRTSHEVAPDRVNALMLAGTYYDMAVRAPEPEREELVRSSFAYFMEYVGYCRSDPLLLQKSFALLAQNYEARFPFLEPEIREARRVYLQ